MKFKVGDKVNTKFGNGEIVFVEQSAEPLLYLIKVRGSQGHDGSSYGYVNEDGVNDKWWLLKEELEFLENDEYKEE